MCSSRRLQFIIPSAQDHYPAIDRDSVKMVMNNMVQAGRLQHVPHHPSFVRMGGVVRQIEAEHAAMQALSVGDADATGQEDPGKIISDKVCCKDPWSLTCLGVYCASIACSKHA